MSATQVPLNNTAQYSGCYVHEGFHSALMTFVFLFLFLFSFFLSFSFFTS